MEKEAQACAGDPRGFPGEGVIHLLSPRNAIFTEKTQQAITCPSKLGKAEVRTRSPRIISQRTLQWWIQRTKNCDTCP